MIGLKDSTANDQLSVLGLLVKARFLFDRLAIQMGQPYPYPTRNHSYPVIGMNLKREKRLILTSSAWGLWAEEVKGYLWFHAEGKHTSHHLWSDWKKEIPFHFLFFFFFWLSLSMRDLSSWTRDRTHAPLQWKWGILTTGPPGNSGSFSCPSFLIFIPHWKHTLSRKLIPAKYK